MEAEKPRIQLAHAPTRCPYCHEGVDPEAAGWLACAHCLARHHDECWNETGRCGSCARTEALGRVPTKAVPKPLPPLPRGAHPETRRRGMSSFERKVLIALAVLPFIVGGFVVTPEETAVFLVLSAIVIGLANLGKRASR